MHIVIAGPGALGCLLAARISRVLPDDNRLTLLDYRQNRARQLNSRGFRCTDQSTPGRFTINTTADPGTISSCDLFFVCTRTSAVRQVLARAEHLLTPDCLLIGMQRGISHVPLLEKCRATAAAAVTSADIFMFSKQPEDIHCLDSGHMHIGLLNHAAGPRRLQQAVDLLNPAGMKPQTTTDIRQEIMQAFFIDLAHNALAAIYKRPNGQLLTSCSVRENMKKLLQEAVAVMRADNTTLTKDPAKAAFHFLRTEKKRIAPMLRDVGNKKLTEIQALNGYISVRGKELAIPTPINDDLVQRIHAIEDAYPCSPLQ
jgi:2-dehydropantoate 2-reductase